MEKNNDTQEVNKAIEENREKALARVETQIIGLKAQKEAKKAIEAAANAGEKAVKKGKSWADVKKAMDDAFKKAWENTKNFGKDVWEKISKIYKAFIDGVKKVWNKVFGKTKEQEPVPVVKDNGIRVKLTEIEKKQEIQGLIEYKPEIEDAVEEKKKGLDKKVVDEVLKKIGVKDKEKPKPNIDPLD